MARRLACSCGPLWRSTMQARTAPCARVIAGAAFGAVDADWNERDGERKERRWS